MSLPADTIQKPVVPKPANCPSRTPSIVALKAILDGVPPHSMDRIISQYLTQPPQELRAEIAKVLELTCPPSESDKGRKGRVPTDWHLEPGERPYVRYDGQVQRVEVYDEAAKAVPEWPLEWVDKPMQDWVEILAFAMMADFSLFMRGWQFRVQAQVWHSKEGFPSVSLYIRRVPKSLPAGLEFPAAFKTALTSKQGFIVIAGTTGAGKSTSLSKIIMTLPDDGRHIQTYENPIEYRYQSKPRTLIRQLEKGLGFDTFAKALGEGALRKDLDILVPTELRDDDALKAAVTAAGSGHTVISTMHFSTVAGVISKMLCDSSPSYLARVGQVLVTVMCQKLVPVKEGGRLAIFELLVVDDQVRSIIAQADAMNLAKSISGLDAQVTADALKKGSFSFEHSLAALVMRNRMTKDEAVQHAVRRDFFVNQFDTICAQVKSSPAGLLSLYQGPAT